MLDLKSLIADVADYPIPGIVFRDITPLLRHPAGLALAVELMANPFRGKGIDVVVGTESRGFIFGTAIAQSLSAGFVPIRKGGKLPRDKHEVAYGLEYGEDRIEVHTDAINPGEKALLVDDLLATGGTLKASCDLLNRLQAEIVGITVLIELVDLKGRAKLDRADLVHAVISY
ncbi:MAG: adenine phosphoribosyltransferase [Phycisphaerales bacterium]